MAKIQAELGNLSSSLQVEALRSLGEVFATLGDLDKSEQIWQQSLTIAQEIDYQKAQTSYQQAIKDGSASRKCWSSKINSVVHYQIRGLWWETKVKFGEGR